MRTILGTGWVPDFEDSRDYSLETPKIAELVDKVRVPRPPESFDVRKYVDLPPVSSQGTVQSCTAFAVGSLLEYFEIYSSGEYLETSKLFLYKTARNLLHQSLDLGALNRITMQALATFGVPPEEFWPYNGMYVNAEPPSFVYSLAEKYQATKYFRYDVEGVDGLSVIESVKSNLAARIPAVCGFYLFPSIQGSQQTGAVPFPTATELNAHPVGGHAVMVTGYDDSKEITNAASEITVGAFLFRNSWGPMWGNQGYGWLPYDYVKHKLAIDWWSLVKADFLETGRFGPDPSGGGASQPKRAARGRKAKDG
jgi:C1A family cysteine protease